MRLKFLAPLVGVLAAFLVTAGAASADTGTFSGSITPTACGPLQPVQVAAGETTIDAVAAATVSANDITLDLYDPSGATRSWPSVVATRSGSARSSARAVSSASCVATWTTRPPRCSRSRLRTGPIRGCVPAPTRTSSPTGSTSCS